MREESLVRGLLSTSTYLPEQRALTVDKVEEAEESAEEPGPCGSGQARACTEIKTTGPSRGATLGYARTVACTWAVNQLVKIKCNAYELVHPGQKKEPSSARREERCSTCDIMLDQARSAQGKSDPRLSATFALR